jgi:tRNA G18 (ribose-2'-O)-methylase SpoU
MRTANTINDINDPRIAPYRSLKVRHPEDDGLFIVESRPAVRSLLRTNMEIVSCLTTREYYENFRREDPLLEGKDLELYLMEKKDIENVIGFRFHHGIMMAAKYPRRMNTEERSSGWEKPHFLVALNGVHDPQNVGLIVRNAAAFGADTLIVDGGTYEPYYRKVARISMGALFNIKIAYEEKLGPALLALKKKFGTRIVVTSLGDDCVGLEKADLSGNICVVLGNEADGASSSVLDIADTKIRIPHRFDRADSLNVACAGAICLYQAAVKRAGS